MITLEMLDSLTGGRLGVHDAPCPMCGPCRTRTTNRLRKVLRVWRELGWASFHCARCGEGGWAKDGKGPKPDPVRFDAARAAATAREKIEKEDRLAKARRLWAQRQPIAGSTAETYLRQARGYGGPLPATLAFLPTRGEYPSAMIAAFGLAHETAPGLLAIADGAVMGVHLTRLKPDGIGKADDPKAKIMIGISKGWPIVLAAPNDNGGLAVTEGIEDGLSVFEETGLGVWVAGAASRMPSLANRIDPNHHNCVSVFTDDDESGCQSAAEFLAACNGRGVERYRIIVDQAWRAEKWAA